MLVFLLGKFHGQRSLAGYSPWGLRESDMTERHSSPSFYFEILTVGFIGQSYL